MSLQIFNIQCNFWGAKSLGLEFRNLHKLLYMIKKKLRKFEKKKPEKKFR